MVEYIKSAGYIPVRLNAKMPVETAVEKKSPPFSKGICY